MNTPAAIRGTFADFRTVKGRKVAQLIIEVPIEQATAALTTLGGVPNPATETWVALARLADSSSPERQEARKSWQDLKPSQQAGIRCGEFAFLRFIQPRTGAPGLTPSPEDAADYVRRFCGIKTRAELETNHKARVLWHQLDTEFQASSGRMAEAR